MRVAGFVLVGGQSSRMGRDKARLPVGSHLLVENVARKVAKVAENVSLVGDPARYADLPFACIRDLHPGLGPISGIEAALHASQAELNIIVACDMPGMEAKWLADLVAAAEACSNAAVVARDAGGVLHPLCAVYRRACIAAVRDAVAAGRLKLTDLLREIECATVDLPVAVTNVNTPEEWQRWLALERGCRPPEAQTTGAG